MNKKIILLLIISFILLQSLMFLVLGQEDLRVGFTDNDKDVIKLTTEDAEYLQPRTQLDKLDNTTLLSEVFIYIKNLDDNLDENNYLEEPSCIDIININLSLEVNDIKLLFNAKSNFNTTILLSFIRVKTNEAIIYITFAFIDPDWIIAVSENNQMILSVHSVSVEHDTWMINNDDFFLKIREEFISDDLLKNNFEIETISVFVNQSDSYLDYTSYDYTHPEENWVLDNLLWIIIASVGLTVAITLPILYFRNKRLRIKISVENKPKGKGSRSRSKEK